MDISGRRSGERRWPPGYARLTLARLMLRSYFFVPYTVLYARQMHISLGTLLVIQSVFAILVVLFDMPAGHIADRIGTRQVLIIGTASEATAALLIGGFSHAWVYWIVQPLMAIAQAFTLGTDAAMANGVLRRAGRGGDFERGERLVHAVGLAWTVAVLASASGFSLISIRTTFFVTAVVQYGAALILATLPDVRNETLESERISLARRLKTLGAACRGHRGLPIDLVSMVLTGTAFSVLLYLMPAYLTDSGVNAHLMGIATAGICLGGALLAFLVPARWDLRVTLALTVLASAAFGIKLVPVIIMSSVIIMFAQARLEPRYRGRIMADLHEYGEATAMSIVTTAGSLGFAVIAPFMGAILTMTKPTSLAFVIAGLFLVAGAVMSPKLRVAAGLLAAPLMQPEPELIEEPEIA